MNTPQLSTKLKVALGYIVLMILLISSIWYINTKMKILTKSDDSEMIQNLRRRTTNDIVGKLYQAEIVGQSLSAGQLSQYAIYKEAMHKAGASVDSLRLLLTDSLQLMRLDTVEMLLANKERNMRNLLQALQLNSEDTLYSKHVKQLIEEQDSMLNIPHVHRKIVTRTNSYVVRNKPKGFFNRLAKAFFPGKGDSTQYHNVIKEEYSDTINDAYSPADTVATLLKNIQTEITYSRHQQAQKVARSIESLRLNGLKLGIKVSQLLSTIENDGVIASSNKQMHNEKIRLNSARTVAIIAIVAVLLAIVFLLFIWRDITRSYHYRKELEKAKKRAEELLTAREKMMLTITHDIKAPVGSIIGYTDLLERLTTEQRQRFYLDNMRSSSKHLLALVNSLLDFHRLDANKMDINPISFNPAQLLETIAISYKPIAKSKELVLEYLIDESLNEIYIGDAFRIRQIVENLLSNALKFTQKGKVALKAEYQEEKLYFSISDTGCGMTQLEKQKIFQEFTRLKNAQGQEGFGLGLAITNKLVHLLHGEISVESIFEKGSKFDVYIPLKQYNKSPDKSMPASLSKSDNTEKGAIEEKRINRSIRILLIDDDKIQLQLTSAMLSSCNVSVTCCDNPDEVFEGLINDSFDIMMTDIQMPAINGFDLLKKIRSSSIIGNKDIPIIAITARSDMDEAYFISSGFSGALHKPFTIKEISDIIHRIVGDCNDKSIANVNNDGSVVIGSGNLDFSALTAFSSDDAQAALQIVSTFISETENNSNEIRKALERNDISKVANIAHKILPLFTMLHADNSVAILKWLEQQKLSVEVTQEIRNKVLQLLHEIDMVISKAREYKENGIS